MLRIACVAIVVSAQLTIAAAAMGATISITPTSGPVGTVVTIQGLVSECSDERAEDVEVYSGTARQLVELDDAGAVAGSMTMTGPATSFPHSAPVHMRCVDFEGAPDGDDITPEPATFTYTAGPAIGTPAPAPGPVPTPCTILQGPRAAMPIDALLVDLDACLQVVLRGTGLANTLFGNVLANVITGLGGNDVLRGFAGDDVIRGGLGNDRAHGDGGDDRLFGDKGDDVVVGGYGSDALTGGPGHDTLQGGAGADAINANDAAGSDVVDGGAGTDSCTVNPGDTVRRCERIVRR